MTMANEAKPTNPKARQRCETCGVLWSKHTKNEYAHRRAVEETESLKAGIVRGSRVLSRADVIALGCDPFPAPYATIDEIEDCITGDEADIIFGIGLRTREYGNKHDALQYDDERLFAHAAHIYHHASSLVRIVADLRAGVSFAITEQRRWAEATLAQTRTLAAFHGTAGIPATHHVGNNRYAARAWVQDAACRKLTFREQRRGAWDAGGNEAKFHEPTGRYVSVIEREWLWLGWQNEYIDEGV